MSANYHIFKSLSQINITSEDGQQVFVTVLITILRYLDLKQQINTNKNIQLWVSYFITKYTVGFRGWRAKLGFHISKHVLFFSFRLRLKHNKKTPPLSFYHVTPKVLEMLIMLKAHLRSSLTITLLKIYKPRCERLCHINCPALTVRIWGPNIKSRFAFCLNTRFKKNNNTPSPLIYKVATVCMCV